MPTSPVVLGLRRSLNSHGKQQHDIELRQILVLSLERYLSRWSLTTNATIRLRIERRREVKHRGFRYNNTTLTTCCYNMERVSLHHSTVISSFTYVHLQFDGGNLAPRHCSFFTNSTHLKQYSMPPQPNIQTNYNSTVCHLLW